MKKQLIIFSLFASVFTSYAQEGDQEEINKENVVVEFSFNPTLSDVFKLKTLPQDKKTYPKNEISYQIKSKAISSDFVPIPKKVVYVNVDERKPKKFYNYVYGGLGFYGNGEFELFLQPKKIKKGTLYGLSLTSYNVQNGIDNKKTDNGQWNLDLGLFYTKKEKTFDWKTNLDYQHNQVHWYGLDNSTPQNIYEAQNVRQTYRNLKLSGTVNYKKAFVNSLSPTLQFFFDDYKSSEVNIKLDTELNPSLFNDFINAGISFQYLNGSFNQSFESLGNINYSFFNIGMNPSYSYKSNGFHLNTTLGLILNNNQENSETKLLFLPKVQADLILIEDIMSLHGGFRSEFNQNSYSTLAAENPFVSPTLTIETTHAPVDVFVGLDGALSKTIKYEVEGGYKLIKNQGLFLHNQRAGVISEAFEMGNSFGVVYDDLNVFYAKANIEMVFSKHVKGGGNLIFNSYDPKNQEKAWNLSGLEIESYINFHNKQWFAQLGVNIVDGRYSLVNTEAKKIDGFLDMNLKAGYKINQKFNAHVNFYNMLSNKYQLYQNYGVQGLQAVVGLSYKF